MGEFADDVGNAVDEVLCIVLLPQLTIYAARNGKGRREGKLFCRNDDRAHGRKLVQAFSKVPLLVGRLDISGCDIIQDGIAKNIVRCFFFAYVLAVLPDNDGKFTFVIKFADDIKMTVNGSVRIDAARDPFGKIDGNVPFLDLFFRVFLRQFFIVGGIVDSQADNVLIRLRDRRYDLDLFHRCRTGHISRHLL